VLLCILFAVNSEYLKLLLCYCVECVGHTCSPDCESLCHILWIDRLIIDWYFSLMYCVRFPLSETTRPVTYKRPWKKGLLPLLTCTTFPFRFFQNLARFLLQLSQTQDQISWRRWCAVESFSVRSGRPGGCSSVCDRVVNLYNLAPRIPPSLSGRVFESFLWSLGCVMH